LFSYYVAQENALIFLAVPAPPLKGYFWKVTTTSLQFRWPEVKGDCKQFDGLRQLYLLESTVMPQYTCYCDCRSFEKHDTHNFKTTASLAVPLMSPAFLHLCTVALHAGAISYVLYIASDDVDPKMAEPYRREYSSNATDYNATGLLAGTLYQFRVQSVGHSDRKSEISEPMYERTSKCSFEILKIKLSGNCHWCSWLFRIVVVTFHVRSRTSFCCTLSAITHKILWLFICNHVSFKHNCALFQFLQRQKTSRLPTSRLPQYHFGGTRWKVTFHVLCSAFH